jgi:hypothetical protein
MPDAGWDDRVGLLHVLLQHVLHRVDVNLVMMA